ncbi:MAG: ABC transporter permease [Acidaminococcaceae bacterium]|nr:ABC transporter permease [Acidaminococcaceae bacterium]
MNILGFDTNKIENKIGHEVYEACVSTGRVVVLLQDTLRFLATANIKETLRQMAKLGTDSLPIVAMTTMFTGMVLAVQTAKEFIRFGAAESVGGVVAIAMGRELAPVLAGVVVAGRIGAAIAAEIGTMKVTEQIDALRVMATNPVSYLVVPRFLAMVLMLPILIIFANAVGSIGGGVVATNYADISSNIYITSIRTFMEPWDLIGGMIKGAFFGAIIAIIGCYKGLRAKQGAEGVGIATTSSVVTSIILIFVCNYFLSVILYVTGG